jgi:hypothetical protein
VHYDLQEQERVQKEHLDRFAVLLEDAEASAEAAAVSDDVLEQLKLDTLGPERWNQAVGSMSLQSAYNESRAQERARKVVPRSVRSVSKIKGFSLKLLLQSGNSVMDRWSEVIQRVKYLRKSSSVSRSIDLRAWPWRWSMADRAAFYRHWMSMSSSTMTLQPLPYGYRAFHGEALLANGFGSFHLSGAVSCNELSSN